jgi:hypothetical protein
VVQPVLEAPFAVEAVAPPYDSEFARYASMYRKAFNSNSPVYRFLCPFKSIEGIRVRRARPSTLVQCIPSGTGATVLPANVISSGGLTGNVLLGACRPPLRAGRTTAIHWGPTSPWANNGAMLFFQDRSAAAVNPSWSGGGSFGLAGSMYFHYCNSADGPGKGTNCSNAAYTGHVLTGRPLPQLFGGRHQLWTS